MNNIQQLTQQFLEDVFSSPEYADILFNYDTSSRSYYAIREVSQRFTVLVSDLLSLTSNPNYESIYNAVKAIHVTNKQYHDPKNASLQIICDLVLSKVPSIENRNNDLRVNGILEYLKTGEANRFSGDLAASEYRKESIEKAIKVLEEHSGSYWFKTDLYYGFKMLNSLCEGIEFGCRQSEKSSDWNESYIWSGAKDIFEYYSKLFLQDNSDTAKYIDYRDHTGRLGTSREAYLQDLGIEPFKIDVSNIILNAKPLGLPQ